jgi:hypothetical protein
MNFGAIFNVALGNRGWGATGISKYIGRLFMAFGCFVTAIFPWWAFFAFLGTLFFFRVWEDSGWLDMATPGKHNWLKGFIRSSAILPHAFLITYLTSSSIPLIAGLAMVFLIPAIYYLASKQTKIDPVAISEIVVGALISTI